jgi:hypothetical protein
LLSALLIGRLLGLWLKRGFLPFPLASRAPTPNKPSLTLVSLAFHSSLSFHSAKVVLIPVTDFYNKEHWSLGEKYIRM